MLNIWEFYVKQEFEKQFEILNGAKGEWSEFFSKSSEFLGINCLKGIELILKNEEMARRYLTQNQWKSQEGFERYVQANQGRYNELSEMNQRLILDKNHMGFFELDELDVSKPKVSKKVSAKVSTDSTKKVSQDLTTLEREVKDIMNAVYFGHKGRPDYDGLIGNSDTIGKIVFSYFQRLLEDKPEIITLKPEDNLTEEQKLYGAFCAYADFARTGYNTMSKHRGDSELGKKIIARLQKGKFSDTRYVELAFSYIIGTHTYKEIGDRFGTLSVAIINGPLKEAVIQKAKEIYNVN